MNVITKTPLLTAVALVVAIGFVQAEEAVEKCCATDSAKTDAWKLDLTADLKDEIQSGPTAIACNITDPKAFAVRKQETTELFSHASKVIELDNGYRIDFDSSYVDQIIKYLEVERECCPFFTFTLHFPANKKSVQLDITGPPESKEIFAPLMDKKN